MSLDNLDADKSKNSAISRGAQTILTSRGLLSPSNDEGTATVISTENRVLVSQSCQATPRHPSTIYRAPHVILRDITSFESTESVPHNEVVTFTLDYDNRSPNNRMLSVQDLISYERNENYNRRIDSPPPALFLDDINVRKRYCNWMSCCYKKDQRFFDVNRRAPPSYSSIYPFYRGFENNSNNYINNYRNHTAVLINNCSSFIPPVPPPSYAQDQGICVAESLEQFVSNSVNNGVILTPRSTTAICPRCATLVFTVVEMQQATTTHIMALAFFLIGCWPCCILPYCIDSCKTSHHYCPYCRTYIGTYTP